MSYAGLGTQTSIVSEPPKDPVSSGPYAVTPVPMTPGLYTLPQNQNVPQNQNLPRLVPAPLPHQQAPVSNWRVQIQRILDGLGVMIMTLPGEIIAQLWALLAGLGPTVRQEGEEFSRALSDPTKTDAQVAEKLKAVSDRYRSLRPSLPAPAIRLFDPIVDGAVGLVPADVMPPGTIQSPSQNASMLDNVPWLWVAGSFVAGMFAGSFFSSPKKTTPNRRRVRRNRRRR